MSQRKPYPQIFKTPEDHFKYACMTGDIETVEKHLNCDKDLVNLCHKGRTILYLTMEKNQMEVAQLLINSGANPNILNTWKFSFPLLTAVRRGEVAPVLFLLKNGANPDLANKRGEYPLLEAVKLKKYEITKLLLEYSMIRIHTTLCCIREYETSLLSADCLPLNIFKEIMKTFCYSPSVNRPFKHLKWKWIEFPLYHAVSDASKSFVSLLLQYGADPNQEGEGQTVGSLLWHISIPHKGISTKLGLEITEELLRYGANPNRESTVLHNFRFRGMNLIRFAIDGGKYDLIELLLKYNVDIPLASI